ncbi:hypothetical protein L0F63_002511 [Massospora cicadina]|nr:hypothetical protein L0F63_002511 [Massospora cicadina]
MSSKLDLSLDEIIKSRPKSKSSGRRRGGTVRKGRGQVAKTINEKPYVMPAAPRLPAFSEKSFLAKSAVSDLPLSTLIPEASLKGLAWAPYEDCDSFTPSIEPSVPITSRVGPLRNESTKKTNGRPSLQRAKSKPVNKRKKEAQPAKSKDDLDAELDAYNATAAMEE